MEPGLMAAQTMDGIFYRAIANASVISNSGSELTMKKLVSVPTTDLVAINFQMA